MFAARKVHAPLLSLFCLTFGSSAARAAAAATDVAVPPVASGAPAAPPPLLAFARPPAMEGVSISPDGHYLAFISSRDDRRLIVVLDRQTGQRKNLFGSQEHGKEDFSWCGWANEKRLLCAVSVATETDASIDGTGSRIPGHAIRYEMTRLVGLDADGKNFKILMQRAPRAQFQDEILDWTPDDPDSVLIQVDDDRDGFPSVYKLNVNTGALTLEMAQKPPIRDFYTDHQGHVRLAEGLDGLKQSYLALASGEQRWKTLATFDVFGSTESLLPLSVVPGTDRALALGDDADHRQVLWELDLADKVPPKVLYEVPDFDIRSPILSSAGKLLGVYYEREGPGAFYIDKRAKSVIDGSNQFLKGSFNTIQDVTRNEGIYIIKAESDADDGTFYALDVASGHGDLENIGSEYPQLAGANIGHMKPITYPAADGTQIPGYLTVPDGADPHNLPLIVMPHGGPIARDSMKFDFLRAFLVSRGYAVLQMNFRGSSGYGWKWFHDAHQDWGGLTYTDIRDGARWAVQQKIADPKRMCILGWSFGGYAALLAAERDGAMFRCAVSIAGVSDLVELDYQSSHYLDKEVIREQLGRDRTKLKADSPQAHASDASIPILLIHGENDWTVPVEHSQTMATALKHANKPVEFVVVKHADHYMRWQSDRVLLLSSVERFLGEHMGAAQ